MPIQYLLGEKYQIHDPYCIRFRSRLKVFKIFSKQILRKLTTLESFLIPQKMCRISVSRSIWGMMGAPMSLWKRATHWVDANHGWSLMSFTPFCKFPYLLLRSNWIKFFQEIFQFTGEVRWVTDNAKCRFFVYQPIMMSYKRVGSKRRHSKIHLIDGPAQRSRCPLKHFANSKPVILRYSIESTTRFSGLIFRWITTTLWRYSDAWIICAT